MVDPIGTCSKCTYWDPSEPKARKKNDDRDDPEFGVCKVGRSIKGLTSRDDFCEWYEKEGVSISPEHPRTSTPR